MKKTAQLIVLIAIGFATAAKASTVTIYDDSFSTTVSGIANTQVLSAVFGSWDSATSTFTAFGNVKTLGYGVFDNTPAAPELQVLLNQTSPLTGLNIAAGTNMALGLYNALDSSTTLWNTSVARAVLTDVNWVAPNWTSTGNDKTYGFAATTTAVFGTFTYSATGNDSIGLTLGAIPEPSVASLLALGTVGLVALRVRRKS